MLQDSKDMESLVQKLESELATERNNSAEKSGTETDLTAEFNTIRSSMTEFFGRESLTMLTENSDVSKIGNDFLTDNKGQFQQSEDMLKTTKVIYSFDKVKVSLIQQ